MSRWHCARVSAESRHKERKKEVKASRKTERQGEKSIKERWWLRGHDWMDSMKQMTCYWVPADTEKEERRHKVQNGGVEMVSWGCIFAVFDLEKAHPLKDNSIVLFSFSFLETGSNEGILMCHGKKKEGLKAEFRYFNKAFAPCLLTRLKGRWQEVKAYRASCMLPTSHWAYQRQRRQ